MLVVGGIIGSGIFLNPAIVAQRVHTPGAIIGVWLAGGVVALAGAFCFAELGARKPLVGGGYAYLRDALGPLPAFLYGWALLLVIATGATAAVAMTFAHYFGALCALPESAATPIAVVAIVALSAINVLGVRFGAVTQNLFTILKLAALAAVIAAGLVLAGAGGDPGAAPAAGLQAVEVGADPGSGGGGGSALALAFGAALVPVLFAYGGWQQTNFVAEELVEPERNLPRALVLGTLLVLAVYVGANLAYLEVLGTGGLAASHAPAADLMEVAFGRVGRAAISAGIACSTFGFLNLVILVTPRVYQAMAADGTFLPVLARLHPRFRTPALAIAVQGGWAVALALSGTYGQLLDYVVFGDWIFFGLTAATLFLYRLRDGAPQSFAVPLWPWTPALFVAAAAYVVVSSVASNPLNALGGAALIAAGVPVFWLWRNAPGRGGTAAGPP